MVYMPTPKDASIDMVDFIQITSINSLVTGFQSPLQERPLLGLILTHLPIRQTEATTPLSCPSQSLTPDAQNNLLHIYLLCPKYSTQVPTKQYLIWFSLLFLSEVPHQLLPELLHLLCAAQACDQPPSSPLMLA